MKIVSVSIDENSCFTQVKLSSTMNQELNIVSVPFLLTTNHWRLATRWLLALYHQSNLLAIQNKEVGARRVP